jgi:spore maturation protein CgeB
MMDRLIGKAHMEQSDLIFLHLQSAGAIDVETAKELSKVAFVVNYTLDVRNDNSWYKEIAPHIGLTLFGDWDSVEELKKSGIKNLDYLGSSADYSWYRPLNLPRTEDIVFIGGNYANTALDFPQAKQRVEMVEFMKDTFGDRFKYYGMGWKAGIDMVNPQQEIEIYNRSKIAITHNNFIRGGYTSDRLWRALGCGIATISQYYPGINKDLNKYVASTWLDFPMLKQECEKLLNLEEEREAMGKAGAEWVRMNHSWRNRISQLKELIQKHKP